MIVFKGPVAPFTSSAPMEMCRAKGPFSPALLAFASKGGNGCQHLAAASAPHGAP